MTIPTTEPLELRAGDTWEWRREDLTADYPAGTWTLTYRFKNAAGGFEVVASADGANFAVTVAASTTAGYTAGTYAWAAQAVNGTTKKTVDSGTLKVLPNLFSGTASAASDQRTHAKKTLDAIEAVIEGRASIDQAEFQIGGRMLKRMPVGDLLRFRAFYKTEVEREAASERLANGVGIARKIQVRM